MTDHFSAVEDAVIALVKAHLDNKDTYFTKSDKQVVKSDDTMLSEGFDYFFITFPSAFPTLPMGTGVIETVWMVRIEIFVRFSTNLETWSKFKAFRSDVFNLFNVKQVGKTLNRTPHVRDVLLASESDPIFYGEEDTPTDPVFYSQQMVLSVFYKINRE